MPKTQRNEKIIQTIPKFKEMICSILFSELVFKKPLSKCFPFQWKTGVLPKKYSNPYSM
jgi:hypothetical protein